MNSIEFEFVTSLDITRRNTYFKIKERIERELAEVGQQVDSQSNLICNIQDTLRSRGFMQRPIDEGVIAMAQDRDEWKAIAESLAERASVCLDNSHWEVKFGSGDLRDSIARFNTKKGQEK